ncbi:MAG: tetratricopeptide repeat protein [Candidatus Omnitrophica bacterium]|nr:tetratricopeptide repeat protein [Candidatus Omnitrophota bacterium]
MKTKDQRLKTVGRCSILDTPRKVATLLRGKRSSISWVLVLSLVFLAGCVDIDPRYASEKLLWRADQKAAKVLGVPADKVDKLSERMSNLKDAEFEEIISSYKKVAEKFPLQQNAALAQFKIANFYLLWKKPEEAQNELKVIIQNFSSVPNIASKAQFTRGKIFELQKKYDLAFEEYEKVIDLYPLSELGLETPIYMARLRKSIEEGSTDEKAYRSAVKHYEKIIDEYADTTIASIVQGYLARVYFESKEWEEALKVWDEITIKYPNTPQAAKVSLAKAEVYVSKMKDIPSAIEVYEDFIKTYPDVKFINEVKLRLGNLYLVESRVEEARRILSSLIDDYPEDETLNIRSRLALVECLKKQASSREEVIQSYESIKALYPDSLGSLGVSYLIYRHYKSLEDLTSAQAALNKAISEYEEAFRATARKEEKQVLAQLLLLCYAEKEDWSSSLSLLEGLSQSFPEDPRYLLSIASLYLNKLSDKAQAIKAYEEVIEKFSANAKLVTLVKQKVQSLNTQN